VRKRWEYAIVKNQYQDVIHIGAVMDDLGQAGWELCAIDQGYYVYKRRTGKKVKPRDLLYKVKV